MEISRAIHVLACVVALVVPSLLEAAAKETDAFVQIKDVLESRYPEMKIVDVHPAPIPSLYEVFTGKEILYTDKSANYLIAGSIVDTRTKKDLTEDRVNERNAIAFASLPFDQAIKIVKGSGERRVAVFSDPDCPYCRRLEEEMKSVTDLTVYVFLFPLAQIHPKALEHAKSIWCAEDRTQAWSEWMLKKKEPKASYCDNDPISALQALGDKLNISGTPTLYFENGYRVASGMSAADLEKRLAEAKSLSPTIDR